MLAPLYSIFLFGCHYDLNWPKILKDNQSMLESLGGGYTNETFVLNHQGQKYVVKYLAMNAENLGVNRDLEFDFQSHAATKGLSPQILYINKDKGIYVAEFIEGDSLTAQDIQKEENLVKAIQLLKKLHKRTREIDYRIGGSPLGRAQDFVTQLRAMQSPDLKDIEEGYQKVLSLEKNLPYGKRQVASHNDYFSANIIHHQGHLKVIDWEYAGWASPYNDLTLMIIEDHLPDTSHDIILKTYFGSVGDEQRALLKRILFIQRFVTLCWYATQLSNTSQKSFHKEYRARYEKHLKVFQNSIY